PDRYVATMSKAKRTGKIFIDWLRNERGATAIAPYSTRSRAGAPVATPVTWDELAELDAANGFTLDTVAARLDEADPWADYDSVRQSLTKPMLKAVAE
ncbi:MAG: ATP-dependent DNA ligase, partial [Aurantimonas coralicida]|nr:ATP-dependent DNA ligase [Aurantimonas coralicida]